MSRNQAAKRFGIGISTAINWTRRLRETGSVEPGQMGGHKPKAISGEHAAWLSRRIKEGDFTLRGLMAELAGRGLKVDYRSVWEFVHAEKLSFKKSVGAGERDRPDVARRRAQWIGYQNRVEPDRLVDPQTTAETIAQRNGCSPRKVNMTISLAFLSPALVKAALEGRLPRGIGVTRLCDMPAEWSRQHRVLGLNL
ncbi:MAG: transposase [Pseudorhodoplanes sp.]|nr:MAG: transposase [Pseudorhodoplanes sp.]